MPNKAHFYGHWISDSRFMEWIVRSASKENVQIKLYKCDISLSNMGEKELHSPAYLIYFA